MSPLPSSPAPEPRHSKTPSVWAPRARHVELLRGDQRHPMTATGGGWFVAHGVELAHGDRYAFSLDGGPLRPDPRSAHQPDGVHGASRFVDLAALHDSCTEPAVRFTPPPLSPASLVYELHIGTFSPEGTFDGAARKLGALVELGVTHVELMPVNAFPGTRGWGYDGVGLHAVQECYGGPDGLLRLVRACHQVGIAVLLDVVFNHLGPDGNYLADFGPYLLPANTAWGPAVNLDEAGSDETRRFFIDAALNYLERYELDGFRLDACDALFDRSAYTFLEQLSDEVQALGRQHGKRYVLIAEHDLADPRHVRDRSVGGYGLDGQWADDFHHAVHAFLTGERAGYYQDFGGLEAVATTLNHGYAHRGDFSAYRGRRHGRSDVSPPRDRLFAYLQNHDQIGNRPAGDRLTAQLFTNRLEQAMALLFASPFIPMIFQGEEWASRTPFPFFIDHHDGLAELVRGGRRRGFREFGWPSDETPDPQALSTFESAKLDWHSRESGEHGAFLALVRALAALRRSEAALTGPHGSASFDEAAGTLLIHRGPLLVAFAFGTTPVRIGGDLLLGRRVSVGERTAASGAANVLTVDPSGFAFARVGAV